MLQKRQWMSRVGLSGKLTALFAVFAVIPMVLVGWIAFNAADNTVDQIGQQFEYAAVNIADTIDRNLFERYGDVQAFGLNSAVSQTNYWYVAEEEKSPIVQVMNQYVDTYDIYFLSLLVDLKGRLIAVNTKDADGKLINAKPLYANDYSQAPWFLALKAKTFTTKMPFTAPGNDVSTGTFVEDLHLDKDVRVAYPGKDGMVIGFSAPVYRDGQVIAYWSNRAKFSLVEDIVKAGGDDLKSASGANAEITVLDGVGRVIVDYDPASRGTDKVVRDFDVLMKLNLTEKGVSVAQKAVNGKRGYENALHTRKHILQSSGYAHLKGAMGFPGMNWSVLVRVPLDQAAAASRAIQRNVLVAAAACLLLILPAGLFVGRKMVVQLKKLVATIERLSAGDLSARATVASHDEIGQLADSFNQMGDSLEQGSAKQQELVGALNAANANLVLCDRSLVITYLNEGARASIREILGEIRKVIPAFDLDTLLGGKLDAYCPDPAAARRLLEDPSRLPHRMDVTIGAVILDLTVKPLFGAKGEHVGSALEWVNVTEARANEKTVVRMQAALEHAGTNFMIADEREEIIFVNRTAATYLKRLEPELRQYIPGFDADKIVGGSIHRYHKDPQAIKNILAGLKPGDVRRGEITPGPLVFEHQTRAVFGPKGEKLAYVVEWRDVTSERKTQRMIDELVQGASKGRLSQRIELHGLEGVYKAMSSNVNRLLDAISVPMKEIGSVMEALSTCDLTKTMTGQYEGEFEEMQTGFNKGLYNLTQTVVAVREAVEAVSAGAEQITKGNEDLAQRTSQQASSLEETSASMEEMTGIVKQSADNAKQANQLASAARETADRGGAVTSRAVEAMGEINKSSKKIADIITVIDEIAFQTNLLALNAAVEAARAGEHGRGFAVVAAEVRNLAQRSATAAKEIKGLINESIQRVNEGSDLVDRSGKTLEEIVISVKRVTDIIAEITAAAQEQASGIDQVNRAVGDMDQTTQQNAALVEETTSASQSLQQQARELYRRVLGFKVQNTEAEKAAMPEVDSLRAYVAETIHQSYGSTGDRDGSGSATRRAMPVFSGRQGGRPSRAAGQGQTPRGDAKKGVSPQPAGVGAGHGTYRPPGGDEFEEF